MLTMSTRTAMEAHRSLPSFLLIALLALLCCAVAGCGGGSRYQQAEWPDGPEGGDVVLTKHYATHTTLTDSKQREAVATTLERSRVLYEQLAPLPTRQVERRTAFVFGLREDWAEHTRQTQGSRAALYLNIDRGGFADSQNFSTFFSGSVASMLATVRHEGFHQHIALGFKERPPAFLEEGLATLFEEGFDYGDITKPRSNFRRLRELREAVQRRRAWSLDRLLTMHAGHVVGANDHRQVGTFYAQAWALAYFLVTADGYREKTPDLMAAYADGSASPDPRLAFERAYGKRFNVLVSDYEQFVFNLVHRDTHD